MTGLCGVTAGMTLRKLGEVSGGGKGRDSNDEPVINVFGPRQRSHVSEIVEGEEIKYAEN